MIEEWRDISESPLLYQISSLGNVRRKGCELCAHALKIRTQPQGYRQVSIYLANGRQVSRMVHRLMAIAFIPNPLNLPAVNHKDGAKSNNGLENLEWVSYSENTRHAYANGLIKSPHGDSHWTRKNPEFKTERWRSKKLSFKAANQIRKSHQAYDPQFGTGPLAKLYGVSRTAINEILRGSTWRQC